MNDFTIFRDITFQDLLADIYDNTSEKSVLIKTMIEDLRSLVETPEDAIMVIPLIVQYLDVGIKNDKHLIELSNTIEKYKKNIDKSRDDSPESSLDDSEMEYLIKQAEQELLEELKTLEAPKTDIEE